MDNLFRVFGFGSGSGVGERQFNDMDIPEDNGYSLCGYILPEEIIIHILHFMNAKDLIKSASVCKLWNYIISQRRFWLKKLANDGIKISECGKNKILNLCDNDKAINILERMALHKLPFNKNLIRNPSGQDEFKHWKIRPGGNGVKVECPPVGSDQIPEEAGLPTQHCFVTSYNTSKRNQVIELNKCGFLPWIMDELKPQIIISEWVSARFDCDSLSCVEVKLLSDNNCEECVMEWSSKQNDVQLTKWYKMEKKLDTYPNGLKRIIFDSSGSDHQFWAGHYGSKTAGSSVKIVL